MEINCFNTDGKKLKGITVPKGVFGLKANDSLLAQAVRVYFSNQRRAYAKTKSRGEVKGSRRKIWRQKGTGRARHGDRYAPIFVGGGIAHGPKGDQNFSLSLSQKMKTRALALALSDGFKQGKLLAVKDLSSLPAKTKPFAGLVKALKLEGQQIAFVLPQRRENVARGVRNLSGSKALLVKLLNPYQVLSYDYLVFTPEAISLLVKERLSGLKAKAK